MKLSPTASTLIRSSPAPGVGSGSSSIWRTSGPPVLWIRIARMLEHSEFLLDSARGDLFGGQAIDGRSRHSPHRQHEIDLPAMMRLVLDHGAKPFPGRDRRAGGRAALRGEILIGQRREDCARLGMQPVVEVEHVLRSRGEIGSTAFVSTRPLLHVLGVHLALDRREVANEIAEAESAFARAPFEIRLGNERNKSTGALVD